MRFIVRLLVADRSVEVDITIAFNKTGGVARLHLLDLQIISPVVVG